MSLSANITATWQAAIMAGLSNILAQGMTLYTKRSKYLWEEPHSINYATLFNFVLYAIIATPPNFEWQMWLERAFPGYYYVPSSKHKVDEKKSQKIMPTSKTGEKKLNKTNTLIKFAFDQVIGSTINSLAFIAFFAYIDGRDITTALQKEFWPMRIASLKLWPAVSLLSYTVIPAQHRINFANVIGIGWGVYLSLLAM